MVNNYFNYASQWLEDITQPSHPYYHSFQLSLFSSLSYVSATYFTSIHPLNGTLFIALSYMINQLTAPLFVELFEPYQKIPLAPLIGQVLHLIISIVIAKNICHMIKYSLTWREIRLLGLILLINIYVLQFILLKIRQQAIIT